MKKLFLRYTPPLYYLIENISCAIQSAENRHRNEQSALWQNPIVKIQTVCSPALRRMQMRQKKVSSLRHIESYGGK